MSNAETTPLEIAEETGIQKESTTIDFGESLREFRRRVDDIFQEEESGEYFLFRRTNFGDESGRDNKRFLRPGTLEHFHHEYFSRIAAPESAVGATASLSDAATQPISIPAPRIESHQYERESWQCCKDCAGCCASRQEGAGQVYEG